MLVAEEAAGARALRLVGEAGHESVLVVTTAAAGGPTALAAAAQGAPLAEPATLRDPAFAARLRESEIDLLLNVHSLLIVRPEILGAPLIGSFNLHPGPLPSYAGLDAPSWAIVEGATEYGCTVHWMDEQVDAGAIAYASSFAVGERETGLSLNVRCAREGLELLARLLDAAAAAGAGGIPALPQDLRRRRYLRRGPPADGVIDWTSSAVSIDRFVRACDFHPLSSSWDPGPRTWLDGREVRIVRAAPTSIVSKAAPGTVSGADDGRVHVATGDVLLEVEAVAGDGRPSPAAAVLPPGAVLLPHS